MAALKDYLSQALMIIKNNGNGRLLSTDSDWFEVNYETERHMISDAQLLTQYGYNTRMDRKFFNMVVSMGL